ncbi:MAG: hypothetical protein ACSLFB_13785 [Acidimicrobiales bacterium]
MQRTLIPIFVFLLVSLAGCGTVDYFAKKYDGYSVVDKLTEQRMSERKVEELFCVMPSGQARCSRRYGQPFGDSCQCRQDEKMVTQIVGHEQVPYTFHIMILRSPSGETERFEVTDWQYNAFAKGDVIHPK